ncbi:MAG: polymer-forming cytoskeletal protein [Nanoarchaeota archaeon]|nr:polymer-forming cytoskeletal protein [Nanoarchaeota archaeon]
MKKSILLFVVMMVLATSVYGLVVIEDEEINIKDDVDSGLYAAGGTVLVDADVAGGLTAFGGTITLDGNVMKGMMACGGDIDINSLVAENIFICGGNLNFDGKAEGGLFSMGGNINIDGDIGSDVRIMGGNIAVNGAVDGDVIVMGGSVIINGYVSGGIFALAGEVTINGIVEGDVEVNAEKLRLGKDALIKGDLKYTSRVEPDLTGSKVGGRIIKGVAVQRSRTRPSRPLTDAAGKIANVLSLMLVSVVLVLLFPSLFDKGVKNIREKALESLLLGLLVLVIVPFAALLIGITIIGIPIALILILLYIIAIYLSKIFFALFLGDAMLKGNRGQVISVILGAVLYAALGLIPYIGGLVRLLALLLGLGAMAAALRKEKPVKTAKAAGKKTKKK